MDKHTVAFFRENDSGDETEIEVEVRWCPESPAYFDRDWGNMLPGDPETFEVLGAWYKGTTTGVVLTQQELDRLEEDRHSLGDDGDDGEE